MSFRKKLEAAAVAGIQSERGRVLWLIDEIEKELSAGVNVKIMSAKDFHIAKTKLRMFIALGQKLKRGIIGNVHPKDPVEEEDPDDDGSSPVVR